MEISKALLVKFLANKCSREEGAFVYQYLLQNPQILDEWLDEEEWELFSTNEQLMPAQGDAWLAEIQERKNRKAKRVVMLRRWISAAAVLLISIGFITYQLAKQHPQHKPQVMAVTHSALPSVPLKKKYVNHLAQPVSYTLSDSSVIVLYANSTLECVQPFERDKRTLVLQGKALFRVAKDKKRPFTVFTEHFSTTALGTVFRIDAYSHSLSSLVKLISGKVVVRNLQHDTAGIYLLPGDACTFSTTDNRLHLHAMSATPLQQPRQAVTETEDAIVFFNAPLPEVFNHISRIYGVAISTENGSLEHRRFTGTFLKTDTPDALLNLIAQLNNFAVVKNGTQYRMEEKP